MTINRFLTGVICVLLLLAITAFISPPVWAATCNPPEGTLGKTRDGREARCKDGTAAPCTGMMLGDGGVWVHCKVDEKPEPVYCPTVLGVREWSVGEARCDSDPRGDYTGTDHILPRTPSGYPRLVQNFAPGRRGAIVYACEAGRWVERGRTCSFASPPTTATNKPSRKPKPRAGDAQVGSVPKRR